MGEFCDEDDHERFFSVNPKALIPPEVKGTGDYMSKKYLTVLYYPHNDGKNFCSSTTISFHYVVPSDFINKLKLQA
jgi:hypothetical protein